MDDRCLCGQVPCPICNGELPDMSDLIYTTPRANRAQRRYKAPTSRGKQQHASKEMIRAMISNKFK